MKIDTLPSIYNEFYDNHFQYEIAKPMYFVFGSNLAGRHGKGAALTAKNLYQAKTGKHTGFTGRCYGIPTKDENLVVLPLDLIELRIADFIKTTQTSGKYFFVTPVGCGLAGYRHSDIAPLFKGVQYCWLPIDWFPYLT